MKRSTIIVLLFIMLLFTGCETITYDALLFDEIASMNNGSLPGDYKIVGQFNYTTRASFTAFDLVTLHDPEIITEMKKAMQVNDGNAVINLSIVEVTDPIDILINIFVSTVTTAALRTSIDIFSTRSVRIKGDVVHYEKTAQLFPAPEQQLLAAETRFNTSTKR